MKGAHHLLSVGYPFSPSSPAFPPDPHGCGRRSLGAVCPSPVGVLRAGHLWAPQGEVLPSSLMLLGAFYMKGCWVLLSSLSVSTEVVMC